ncbi:MAG: UvrB/UvrC motif-containing protein [Phycisphaerae bacterium]
MTLDIGDILNGWPYEPEQLSVRRIRGDDGREKIQVRLDLGLLQMETTGRPDGERPHGHESLLDYHEHRLRRHKAAHGTDRGFDLDEEACEQLRAEGVMYYHRYIAEYVLEDFEAVERDATRNLRLLDFCRAHARREADRYALEQYRPYILMMCTRARARLALGEDRPKTALQIIRRGIADIREFVAEFADDEVGEAGAEREIAILKALAGEIEEGMPPDPLEKLRKELSRAVSEERYEDAASIRNRLDRLARGDGQGHEGG